MKAENLRGAHIVVDLAAIRENYQVLRRHVRPARVGAVLKADAYGLGAAPVARTLCRSGCRDFFVAQLDEGIALRDQVDTDARIFVLHGPLEGEEPSFVTADLIPVLNTLKQVHRWSLLAGPGQGRTRVAIQLDTGMHRLGLPPDRLDEAIATLGDTVHVVLILSHLACAEDEHHPANRTQSRLFDDALGAGTFPAVRSLANSWGATFVPHRRDALVRTGIALFGGMGRLGSTLLRPVVQLRAPVLQLVCVPGGEGVGYGLTSGRTADRRIATIGIGYADGWARNLRDHGGVWFGAARLPIVGAISMDSFAVDASDPGADTLSEGDMVELIGSSQSLPAVAEEAGTIPYEVLVRFGPRVRRSYINVDEAVA
ncbi:MAG: alanine racemase [Caulobacteraceae bacterium]|nr:alanine racemase [Caulobacteraceae bacterium]